MRNEALFLALFNIVVGGLIGVTAFGQDEPGDGGEYTIPTTPLDYQQCKKQDCNNTVATEGEGSSLDYGCTHNASTNTCTGACYWCNGTNPEGQLEICVKSANKNPPCDPSGNNASFQCSSNAGGAADAHACSASGTDSKACCSSTKMTPAQTGRSCAGVTCIKID